MMRSRPLKLTKPTCACCLKKFEATSADLHPTDNYGNAWICKPCVETLKAEQANEGGKI